MNELKGLLSESWNAAVLDSHGKKTAFGQVWLDNYLDSLPENGTSKIQFYTTSRVYHYGDGKSLNVTKKTQRLASIANCMVTKKE